MSEHKAKVLIGKLLREKNVITDEQLEKALLIQQQRRAQLIQPVQIGMILVELGYVSEQKVIQAVNQHYHLSLTSLSNDIDELIQKKSGSLFQRLAAQPTPIALQLSVTTTLIIIFTIFSLSFVILKEQKKLLYQQTVRTGKISLNYFGKNAALPLLYKEDLELNRIITNAIKIDGIRYAIILDNNGIIQAHTQYDKIGGPFEPFRNVEEVTREGAITYFSYYSPSGEHLLNLNRQITLNNQKLGEVHVGISLDFIEQLIYQKSRSVIWVSVAIIVFGIVIAILTGLHFSRPILELVEATQEICKGNYQHKVRPTRNDELGKLAGAFNRMSQDLWAKSLMKKSFGKYVGPQVLEMIMVNPESDWLRGRRSKATILFTDIRGFTAYSEQREPEEVVERLNEYFEITTNTILKYGGYVDKFVGDAVLGVFGVPVMQPDHMEKAVRAALEMQKGFCDKAKEVCEDTLLNNIGIGINSGIVVSGNIGSQMKMEYTVIGDTVNVASRLNGLAGPGEIIISKSVWEHLGDLIEVEKRPPQKIKGKQTPVETYKVLRLRKRRLS